MDIEGRVIVLNIAGVGIVFYSPDAVEHIPEGSDYLASNYTSEEQVQAHVQKGSIVGFATGSPGVFILKFHVGYPDERSLQESHFKLRLGLHCRGDVVCFRDLYDLMDWRAECPPDQIIELEDGFYHVTLCSNRPPSGVLGDQQDIHVYFQKLDTFPRLSKVGIPTLCM
jgi:hypothetical protein